MPTYIFEDKLTKKRWSELMTISEMEHYLQTNSNVEIVPSSPMIVSGVGRPKTDNEFKGLLKHIKSKHKGSTIDY